MLQKFFSLFTRRNVAKRGDTPPADPPEKPFESGTPHSRIHELILAGRPDGLIAVELGVDVAAVRNYRHIISAKARTAARQRAAEFSAVQLMGKGMRDEQIAAELHLPLPVITSLRQEVGASARRAELARRQREIDNAWPDVLGMPAPRVSRGGYERSKPAVFQPLPAPSPNDAMLPLAMGLTASLLAQQSHAASSCPAPSPDFSSGGAGDFGGGGASASFDSGSCQ